MAKITFSVEGKREFDDLIEEIIDDMGEKDAKKILRKTVYEAMKPVLFDAKMRAPVDTGALQASLRINAGKPTRKQKRSKYISPTDVVIATVTTSTVKQLAKVRFKNRKNTNSNIQQIGVKSDARAIANEFGTANRGAKPFLRPALESNAQTVVNSLGDSLKSALTKYRSKKV